TYTEFGLPRTITTPSDHITFVYDASGDRILAQHSSGDHLLSIDRRFSELRHGVDDERRFTVDLAGRPIAQVVWRRSNGSPWTSHVYYVRGDQLGSVTVVTDDLGQVVDRLAYEPFGSRLNPADLDKTAPSPDSGVQIGFAGQVHDDALQLIDMRGRVYDPYLR